MMDEIVAQVRKWRAEAQREYDECGIPGDGLFLLGQVIAFDRVLATLDPVGFNIPDESDLQLMEMEC